MKMRVIYEIHLDDESDTSPEIVDALLDVDDETMVDPEMVDPETEDPRNWTNLLLEETSTHNNGNGRIQRVRPKTFG